MHIEFGITAMAHNFLKQAQVNRQFQGQNGGKRKNPAGPFQEPAGFSSFKRLLRQPLFVC
ncbi:hypothetical protein BTO30_09775 [Domibacillus antri]|uniref:Uncharacterized protein n=1 Tax=Domibacillus antri TaxID=1714264 RepID=A0A1Q8Q4R3_9BACI|nr:hypothetical protein [Domibacillus antri]OLN22343.1 hypothetical protein BTO30_09775 [Domibacillus antri]